ncbi:MAG: hypothetical protein ACFFKA_15990 [Candidatus Thorarchaeota archaeon]
MVRLEDLTVNSLNDLAKEINIKFEKKCNKKERITLIKNTGIDPQILNELILKYLEKKNKIKKESKKDVSELKGRVRLLEDQVKFLMSKISVSEVSLSKVKDNEIITVVSNLTDIKKYIKSLLSPGELISIDELIELKEIQKIPLVTLKHAIYDLIEEGFFEVVEGGSSRRRIGWKIGVLKRL